jgi:hypothetical protein
MDEDHRYLGGHAGERISVGAVARRIDIELTSSRDDGSWTWRAAGAKQPKGDLDGALLPSGAKVGDVLKVEAEFEIEGITIVGVVPTKDKRAEPERLELLGPSRPAPGVTTSLTGKGDRRGRPDRDRRDRGDRPDRGDRERGDRGPRRERAGRPPRERPRAGDRTGNRTAERPPKAEAPAKPKPRKLSPASTWRNAALEAMAPEQRPIGEQLLRGGLPAVRQAIDTQNAAAKEAGQPTINADPLLAMAEELLPALKAAEWRDRAEAAVEHVDDIALRDLRSVVATSEGGARDEAGRELAAKLREALDRRTNAERDQWTADVVTALDEGRLVRALRISARPPDPSTRFPSDLATRLSEAAGEAMAPDASKERWLTLLEAVAASPVRRSVKPAGLPAEPGDELLAAAKSTAGRIPALAPMLGIDMPPPPRAPRRPPRPPRPREADQVPATPPAH